MIRILGMQFYSSRLTQRLRSRARVAHKTGDWPPDAGNDVGILYYDPGPTVVAVFTNQNRGDFFELEATIGRIAGDLVEHWRQARKRNRSMLGVAALSCPSPTWRANTADPINVPKDK